MAPDTAAAPARSRPDPTRRLWQLPVFAVRLTAALAVHNGWLPVGRANPESAYLRDLTGLRAAYERPVPDAADLLTRLTHTAAAAESFPEYAALTHFGLGSGY